METVYLPNDIFDRKITGKELVMLVWMKANGDGLTDRHETVRTAAKETGMSLSSAARAAKTLERRGWITHQRGRNQYRVLLQTDKATSFCFPAKAIEVGSNSRVLVLAYLCMCAAVGAAQPTRQQLADILSVQPQTVGAHIKSLKANKGLSYLPDTVRSMLEKWSPAPAKGGRKKKKP